MDCSEEGEKNPKVLINPEIIWSSEDVSLFEEGCLSIPDIREEIKRPSSVRIKFTDIFKKMNNDTIPFEDSIFINQEAKYILSLLNDETKSSSWLLTNGIHKIGRLETKEIILDDVTVSRNHAFISVDDETVIITDEKSTNGIFVNGELTDESVLTSGSRIQIGKFSLIITKVDKK